VIAGAVAKKGDARAKGVIVKSVTRNGRCMVPNGVVGRKSNWIT
jgi:hypothetical protein